MLRERLMMMYPLWKIGVVEDAVEWCRVLGVLKGRCVDWRRCWERVRGEMIQKLVRSLRVCWGE